MTRKDLQYRLEALAARAALAVVAVLPPRAASAVFGGLARTFGPLLAVSRVAEANLRLAMPELDAAARRRILRGVWDNLGRTVAELPHLHALEQTAHGPGWEVAGLDILRGVYAAGGPVVFICAHLANWEMGPTIPNRLGLPLAGFYRAASNPIVDKMILRLRERAARTALVQFPKGAVGARAALAHLKAGGRVGIMIDQKMNDGIASRLFGHTAMTASAAAAFALRFRCPLVPTHVERIGPCRFRLIVEPPLTLPDSGDRLADIAAVTDELNLYLERWIRARPSEWLWLHRRWPKELTR